MINWIYFDIYNWRINWNYTFKFINWYYFTWFILCCWSFSLCIINRCCFFYYCKIYSLISLGNQTRCGIICLRPLLPRTTSYWPRIITRVSEDRNTPLEAKQVVFQYSRHDRRRGSSYSHGCLLQSGRLRFTSESFEEEAIPFGLRPPRSLEVGSLFSNERGIDAEKKSQRIESWRETESPSGRGSI